MNYKNYYEILLFIAIFNLTFQKLLFVNVHFRHGARGSLYIDKENRDLLGHEWEKRGILTSKGKRQVFLNGIKHRERYSNFLSNKYYEDEIKVYSTDSYRAISSLECYLNGLYHNNNINENIIEKNETVYPPGNVTQIMKEKINQLGNNAIPKDNHIIPINIFQKGDHQFVLHEPGKISDCQIINEIREKNVINYNINIMAKNFMEKYSSRLNNFFNLNNITLNSDFNYSYNQLHLLCDTLYSDFTDKRDLSNLTKELNFDEFFNDCQNILTNLLSDYVSGDKDTIIMSQSPVMKKLINWMDKRIELDKKGQGDKINAGSPKYTVWSGHDSSISTFEMFMKYIFNTKWLFPSFSTTILFELHKNDEKNLYEIKYLLNDETLLTINYDEFKRKVMEIIWNEEKIENFCQFSIIHTDKINKLNTKIKKYRTIIFILTVIIISSLFYNIYNSLKRRKKMKDI